MRICFDLDETLCTGFPYSEATPFEDSKDLLLRLRQDGHQIVIYTARGMGRANGNIAKASALIAKDTFEQLERWGFVYDEISFGKPSADIYVDDKSVSSTGALKSLIYK